MPMDPACAQIAAAFAAIPMPAPADLDPVTYRQVANAGMPVPPAEVARVQDVSLGGIPARLYHPKAGQRLPGLVFYHGGGWVAGTLDTHDSLCRELALAADCAVVSVDYRLAPEHAFPASLDDCIAALHHAAAHGEDLGIDSTRLAVGGDSAGGNLAAVVAQVVTREGSVTLRSQLLMYPVTDCGLDTPSYRRSADGPLITRDLMAWFWKLYAGDTDPTDPRLSPARTQDLSGLPPAIVVTAEYDPLCSEGDDYAERLAAAGVMVRHRSYPGMIHGFMSMIDMVAAARTAIWEAADALVQDFE